MKKKLRLLFFLSLILTAMFPICVNSQNELQIGNSTDPSQGTISAPIYLGYLYSYTESIYMQDELSSIAGKQITQISYKFYGEFDLTFPIKVYMGLTDKNSYEENIFLSTAQMVQVYDGSFAVTSAGGWVSIKLQVPFIYDGSKNLVIAVNNPIKRTTYKNKTFYASTYQGKTDKHTLMYKSDGVGVNDPANPPTTNIIADPKRPDIRVTYRVPPTAGVPTLPVSTCDFKQVESSQSSTVGIKVVNTGISPLTINGATGISEPFSYTSGEVTIPEGGNANINFTFAPTQPGNYSQDITLKHNGEGEASITLKGTAYPAGALLESFENSNFPPIRWRQIGNGWKLTGENPYDGDSSAATETIDTLISPKVNDFSFYARLTSTSSSKLEVVTSTDLKNWTPVTYTGKAVSGSWSKITVNEFPAGSYIGIIGSKLCVDLMQADYWVRSANDIALISATCPADMNEGTDYEFIARIQNWGNNNIVAADWKLEICDQSGKVLTTLDGINLPALNQSYEVKYNGPFAAGATSLQARISYTADEDASNNLSKPIKVKITPFKGNLTISPASLSFGLLMSSSESKTDSLVLKNIGIAPLKLSAFSLAAPFTSNFTPQTLNPDQSIKVYITFSQGEPEKYNQTATFQHDGIGATEVSMSGQVNKPGYLFESFEGVEFPSLKWRTTNNKWKRKPSSTVGYEKGACAIQEEGASNDTLITPKLNIREGDQIMFYARSWSNIKGALSVIYSADQITWKVLKAMSVAEGTLDNTSLKEIVCDLPEIGEYYIGFVGKSEAIVDYVRGPEVIYPEHDMRAISIVGANTGNVNAAIEYTVSIQNLGSNTESDYSLTLTNGEDMLTQIEGISIAPMEIKNIAINWTPRKIGEYNRIMATVMLDTDLETGNNNTATLKTTIAPENERVIQIGTRASDSGNVPLALNYKYSISETLYFANELGLDPGAVISEIAYPYYNDKIDWTVPVRIWMGHTNLSMLDDTNMIQAANLQLVFDNAYTFLKQGAFDKPAMSRFLLNTPFNYTGGNIVIMIEQKSTSYKSIKFYEAVPTRDEHRCTYYQNDATPLSPETGIDLEKMSALNIAGQYPMITLFAEAPAIPITGTLSNTSNEKLEGITVSLTSGDIYYESISDADGAFTLNTYRKNTDYTFTTTHDSYYTHTQSVSITGQPVNLGDIELMSNNGQSISETSKDGITIRCDLANRISVTSDKELRSIRILNLNGTVLNQINTDSNEVQIEMEQVNKGIYIVEVTTATGNRTVQKVSIR